MANLTRMFQVLYSISSSFSSMALRICASGLAARPDATHRQGVCACLNEHRHPAP